MAYPFMTLITGVKNIDELKHRIQDANLMFKEDEHCLLIFSETNDRSGSELEDSVKSLIIDKNTFKPIATQFNKIIYNADAKKFLVNKNWNHATIKYCYEGTMLIVFYAYNKWYVCTRKCLDASTSYWIKDVSYYDLFTEAIHGKFRLDDLNKDYCYHFILLHYKNKNIVEYTKLGDRYQTVALAMTTKKETFERVEYTINERIIYPETFKFNNLQHIIDALDIISKNDKITKTISMEGFIVEYMENGVMTILKLQTDIYEYIANIKPNVSNTDAMFLELYQKDALVKVAPYFTKNSRDVVTRIHNSMKNIANEILSMYHNTRSHKNEGLYNLLPTSYKNILYVIHGKFLAKKTREQNKLEHEEQQIDEIASELKEHVTITVYDVYECLKKMEAYWLRKIFIDRIELLNVHELDEMLDHHNFDTLLQGKLMM